MVASASTTVNASPARPCGVQPLAPPAQAATDLFVPLAPWLACAGAARPPDLDRLNAYAQALPQVRGALGGRSLRFVPPDAARLGYEQRVARRAEVVTRPDNWHDGFNALVWLRFPRTKAALNALHVREMAAWRGRAGRGPLRDAATQFDESGIVVASADVGLLDLLKQREWKTLFWVRREDVRARMRFLVFGHGLYDALRNPFYRMCARAAIVEVGQPIIEGDVGTQCAHIDPILAERFDSRTWYPRPRALLALPILGIPGVTAASESASYYEDTEQFRPLPAWSVR